LITHRSPLPTLLACPPPRNSPRMFRKSLFPAGVQQPEPCNNQTTGADARGL
jgi:hypothetical protein